MNQGRRTPWLDPMVLPTVAVLAVVVGYPIADALLLSTRAISLLDDGPGRFVGLANYRGLWTDPIVWQALGNTAVYSLGSVAAAALAGLALALLTDGLVGWRHRALRALLLTPWAVPFVVVAFLFRYMYLEHGGLLNAVLLQLGLIARPVPWLNAPSLAMPAVMLANIWTLIPFFFLLLSAALAAIPVEVLESARIDRARGWSLVVHIQLPFLRGALLVGCLLMVIANVNDFAKIWALTQGGPGYGTTTLVVYVYRLAFEDFKVGYASAIGVLWLLALLAFATAYLRALRVR